MIRSLTLALLLASTTQALAQHDYKATRGLLRDGKWQACIDLANERFAKDSKDSEWIVQRGLAEARLEKFDAAIKSFEQAIEMGVAPERFVGEARNLLKPVADEEPLKSWLAKHTKVLLHGPMLGRLTPSGGSIWVRTSKPGQVRVTVHLPDDESLVAKGETNEANDLVAVLSFDGLNARASYSYTVAFRESAKTEWRDVREDRLRTSPEQGTITIAFGGGAGYVPENERMWKTIEGFDPTALLLLGDNVYIDMPEHPEMQRFCYYRRHSVPAWRSLVGSRPVYTIWDDHDFGTNDCWGGPEVAQPKWKPDVWSIYRENWVNPGYGGGEQRPGCWYDFRLGDVHFVMLDGRYYRTNPRVDQPSMLGPEQLAWAKKTLAGSDATFKVIVSPVPWEYATKGDSKDTWNGFRSERDDLFSFLTKNEIEGVLLLSADRHRSDAWKIDREGDYALYEFESSRLTNRHVHGTMKNAIFSYNKLQSFGLVTFDTAADDPTITYKIVNIDGEVMHELELERSALE